MERDLINGTLTLPLVLFQYIHGIHGNKHNHAPMISKRNYFVVDLLESRALKNEKKPEASWLKPIIRKINW